MIAAPTEALVLGPGKSAAANTLLHLSRTKRVTQPVHCLQEFMAQTCAHRSPEVVHPDLLQPVDDVLHEQLAPADL